MNFDWLQQKIEKMGYAELEEGQTLSFSSITEKSGKRREAITIIEGPGAGKELQGSSKSPQDDNPTSDTTGEWLKVKASSMGLTARRGSQPYIYHITKFRPVVDVLDVEPVSVEEIKPVAPRQKEIPEHT